MEVLEVEAWSNIRARDLPGPCEREGGAQSPPTGKTGPMKHRAAILVSVEARNVRLFAEGGKTAEARVLEVAAFGGDYFFLQSQVPGPSITCSFQLDPGIGSAHCYTVACCAANPSWSQFAAIGTSHAVTDLLFVLKGTLVRGECSLPPDLVRPLLLGEAAARTICPEQEFLEKLAALLNTCIQVADPVGSANDYLRTPILQGGGY